MSTDYYRTLLDLLGLPAAPEQHRDSVSLRPLLTGGTIDARPLFWHYPHYGNQGGDADERRARRPVEARRMVRRRSAGAPRPDERSVERTNIATKEPTRVRTLHAMLTAWRAETGAQLPTKNPAFNPQGKEAR